MAEKVTKNRNSKYINFICVYGDVNSSNILRLLSSKVQGHRYFWKPSKPFHVGVQWKALAEFSRMSTHIPGFQSFSKGLDHFVLAKLVTSSMRVKWRMKERHRYILPWTVYYSRELLGDSSNNGYINNG